MKIYIAIIEDRHTDVGVEPFATAEEAIEWAKAQQEANRQHPDDPDEDETGEQEITKDMRDDGWIFFSIYSSEGDSVCVIERELELDDEEDGD